MSAAEAAAAEPAAVGTRAPGAGAAGTGTADDPSRGTGGAAPAGAVPEQARPADRPAAGAPASHVEDDPEPGPTGRHALRDDVEPQALPGVGPAEQAGPPEPMPVPPRSGGAATAPGGAAAAAGGTAAAGGSALAALDSGLISPAATSDPVPQGTRPGPFPGSILAPEDGSDPPETHRVKAHSGSRRFHTPESPYYVRTRADLYFTGDSAARAAGFTAWNERPGAG
ncbi:hypothetical protein ACLFMI_06965 [Pseudonocardia nantongensis]|uniref:sunset domain-containing protein n=1 Tax=Pseudonocardia nantongensis TaxID=1181885 RepID=UPI00397A01DB